MFGYLLAQTTATGFAAAYRDKLITLAREEKLADAKRRAREQAAEKGGKLKE